MIPQPDQPLPHGGDLAAFRRLFPDAPEPLVDLSTGINPHPYPLPALPPEAFTRLPDAGRAERVATIAAEAYGAPSADHVVPAPGTQILLPWIARLVPPGQAVVLGPTYAEHARAAAHAGHRVVETADPSALEGADLAIVVNPNNPDGRVMTRKDLERLVPRCRLLVVDEAFMDVGPPEESMAGSEAVVLRSFGKFYGLAGLRLGFALAPPPLAARLRAALGPWPASGPALAVGETALSDRAWQRNMRHRLQAEAIRLNALLAGFASAGGTSLFRLLRDARAPALFSTLGRAGIMVRRFTERPQDLRFGLPGGEADWERLAAVLAGTEGHR